MLNREVIVGGSVCLVSCLLIAVASDINRPCHCLGPGLRHPQQDIARSAQYRREVLQLRLMMFGVLFPFILQGLVRAAHGLNYPWATYELADKALMWTGAPLMAALFFVLAVGPYPHHLRLLFIVMGMFLVSFVTADVASNWGFGWASSLVKGQLLSWIGAPTILYFLCANYVITKRDRGRGSPGRPPRIGRTPVPRTA